jgi:hypothetical protein
VAVLGARRSVGPRAIAGYLAAAWAGLLSNLSFALVAPLHARWWLATPGSLRRRVMRTVLIGGCLAVLAAPWVPQIGRIWDWSRLQPARTAAPSETPLRGTATFHVAALPFAAASFAVGYTLGPSLRELRAQPAAATLRPHAATLGAAALVFGALTALGLRSLHRRGRLGEGLLWLLVPALVVSYFAAQNFKVFHPRYLALAAPGFLVLLAAGFADLAPRARATFALAVAALWAIALHHHYFDPRYGKEDMRGAAALLAARGAPGEQVIAANTEDLLFFYYRGPLPVTRYWLGWAADPVQGPAKLESMLADVPGAWVVLSRGEDLDRDGAFARHLDEHFPDAERFRFEGVRVWHVRRAAPAGAPPSGRS